MTTIFTINMPKVYNYIEVMKGGLKINLTLFPSGQFKDLLIITKTQNSIPQQNIFSNIFYFLCYFADFK